MEQKLRKSYLLMFPLFIIALIVIITIGTWVSAALLRPSMAFSKHSAGSILANGLDENLKQDIEKDGGSVMLIHQDGQIELLAGSPLWNGNTMSMQEISDFLSQVNDPGAAYKYSVAYDQSADGWLVAGFPVSMRVQIFFTANHDSKEYITSLTFYITLGICLAATLFLFALFYARKSAKTYSEPLQKVCASVRQIALGNYEVKDAKSHIVEYKMLQDDVRKLASMLEVEKKKKKQLEDSKRQMLLDISHDLRNPLATILGYSETLCREEGLTKQERETYIEVIYRNSMRAHALMNDLFEYTRLDEPSPKVDKIPMDLCEFLREFAASYVPEIESAGFEYEFEIPEEERFALLDAKQMERALGNIVSNSLKYNQPGTKIKLSLNILKSQAVLQISDNGIGIEPQLCETIFLPFTRADKSRNSMRGGSGLGLSISKKIIESMGGDITLISDNNKGCDFKIHLPLLV